MQQVAQKGCLISPRLDFWLLGGAYFVVLFPVYLLFGYDRFTPEYFQLLAAFTFLSHFFNYPHFLVSYQLLYSDHRSKLFSNWRFIWAAWVSPVVLLGLMVLAFHSDKSLLMGGLISLMGFLSGWHYVKQTFGALIIRSVQSGNTFKKSERNALKINLIALWLGGWLFSTAFYLGPPSISGIRYLPLHLPQWLGHLGISLGILSFFVLAWAMRSRFAKSGLIAQLPEVGIYATGPAWTFPYLVTPIFQVMYPLFHCLQYFVFVIAFRRNQGKDVVRYLLVSLVLGTIAFVTIPEFLDGKFRFTQLGATPFVAAFSVFLNLHHYIIDSVIWKGSDPDVRAHLFGSGNSTTLPFKKSA